MQHHLQRLIHELRAEKCPADVVESAKARIGLKRRSPGLLSLATAGFAVGLAALAVFLILRWPGRAPVNPTYASLSTHAEHVRVAQETGLALGYFGNALLHAGQHSQTILFEQAVPVLQNGLEKVGKTLNEKL
jgi:hypothetical protein